MEILNEKNFKEKTAQGVVLVDFFVAIFILLRLCL